jgi:predicted outer membrane repeat protein
LVLPISRLKLQIASLCVAVLGSQLVFADIAGAATRVVATDGSSEYTRIQTAIEDSMHGDVVEVRPGVYRESLFYGGRRIRVVSTDGPETTIIDATGLGSAAVFIFGESRNAQLSGFTVRGGTGRNQERPASASRSQSEGLPDQSGTNASQLTFGGAILCNSSSPTLEDLIVVGNQANVGGGLYVLLASPFVDRCTFRSNVAGDGGAIAVDSGNLILRECVFEDNDSVKGGAIYGSASGLDCHQSTFLRNTAAEGGAVYMLNNPGRVAALHHSIFFQNKAAVGGAIRCLFGNLDFRYCVVSQNGRADIETTEVVYTNSSGVLRNNVFSSGLDTEHLSCENDSNVSYFCNVFWPAPVPKLCQPGASNLSVDPRFCNAKKGDFRYRADSPLLPENSPTGCDGIGPDRDAECPTLSNETQRSGGPVIESAEERKRRAEIRQRQLEEHKRERYRGSSSITP